MACTMAHRHAHGKASAYIFILYSPPPWSVTPPWCDLSTSAPDVTTHMSNSYLSGCDSRCRLLTLRGGRVGSALKGRAACAEGDTPRGGYSPVLTAPVSAVPALCATVRARPGPLSSRQNRLQRRQETVLTGQ